MVQLVPFDVEVAWRHRHFMADLRIAGKLLPANDIWIAASAVRTCGVVLTREVHFSGIVRVGGELLMDGS